jgi:RNA polymerase sigma-70 factor (ECF subfamily)
MISKQKNSSKAELNHLVERARIGDKKALNDLCERISPSVLYKLKKIVGNAEAAEDISQEVLIKVCRGIKNLREPKAFNGWLARIISNEKNKYFTVHAYPEAVYDIDDYKDNITEEKPYCIPSEWLDKKELSVVVSEVVSDLPERQREAVMLHYYDELSVTETAEVMGIAVANVSSYISNACRNLKNRLEGEQASVVSARGAYTAGGVIAGVLQQDGALFANMNQAFAHSSAAACSDAIFCGVAAAAATTAAATTVATTATATTAAATTAAGVGMGIGAGAATAAAAVEGSFSIFKVVAACLAITATVSGALAFGASQLHQPYQEAPSTNIQSMVNDFYVSFYGGTALGEGIVHVEPEYARVNVLGIDDNVEILEWWITEAQTNRVVYQRNSNSIGNVLVTLRDSGADGEYVIHFEVIEPSGSVFIVSRNFYMPESQEPARTVTTATPSP